MIRNTPISVSRFILSYFHPPGRNETKFLQFVHKYENYTTLKFSAFLNKVMACKFIFTSSELGEPLTSHWPFSARLSKLCIFFFFSIVVTQKKIWNFFCVSDNELGLIMPVGKSEMFFCSIFFFCDLSETWVVND